MKFFRTRSSRRKQMSRIYRRKLWVQKLEDRRLLAAMELSSLLPNNGGDGSAGFVASHQDTGAAGMATAFGDINHDGYDDFLISDPGLNTVTTETKLKRWETSAAEGAVFVVYGDGTGTLPELDLLALDGTDGFVIHGDPDEASSNSIANTGVRIASDGDLNADGVDDLVVMSYIDGSTDGRAYVFFGNPAWGKTEFPTILEVQSLDSAYGGDGSKGFVIQGAPNFGIGGGEASSLAIDGDVNGDGISDLIVGSAFSDPNGNTDINSTTGQAFIIYGRNLSDTSVEPFGTEFLMDSLDSNSGFVINGSAAGDRLGFAATINGDINGDGTDDIVVGAPATTVDGRVRAGRTYVIYGGTGIGGSLDANAVFDINSLVTGDGTIGFVLNGIDGDSTSGNPGDFSGYSVNSSGDFNGDGIDDLVLGAPIAANGAGASRVGEAYIVFGRNTNATSISPEPNFPSHVELSNLNGPNDPSDINSDVVAGVLVRGIDEGDRFGRQVALGDLNGDGFADFVATAPGGDPGGRQDAGEAYIMLGNNSGGGTMDASTIAGDDGIGLVINGIDAGASLGGEVSRFGQTLAIGNFNSDSYADMALGTDRSVAEGYLIFGSQSIVPPPAPGVSVSPSAGLVTSETGDTASFDVVLNTQPAADVTIALSSSDDTEGTIAVTELIFTAANWDVPQTVTVTGQDDLLVDGDVAYSIITGPASSTDPDYDGLSVADVSVTNIDDEAEALYVYDIRFDSRRGGNDWRAVFEIRSDSDGDGKGTAADEVRAGVTITVEFAGQTFTGTTDANGVFRTDWIQKLSSGSHYAEAVDLALAGYVWDPLALDLEDDSDGDGLPDDVLVL